MTLHFHQETARRLCATYSEVYKNEHTPHKTCNGAQRYGADNCCRLFLSCTELTALCGFGVVDTCYSHSQKENFTIKIGKKVQEKYGIAEKTQLIPTKKNPGIQ
ncbi:MAG: hypothetical protein COY58_06890 [Gammaproteobacteria bacterium CG_4_10_14_0_8_um_filter_38_16]|nr:MAG: hypothetical protein COY58_06890 [Gammaproteobacteria bacterium CG_4_10_14_0_8_um_filter_38_16]PJA04190.1 MAG: hypothetical protein COX72_01035 [Gammaproteobacteria bacterium CG_4_10_14_0_2_um_filter_38_22]PJB10369.1 MAG: hypothetical protein CO120_05270 [Gammaproteobacteria bacterium CG_4_9_14_3_um_filter_38_9]